MSLSELEAKLGRNVPVKLWTPLNEVESEALEQLKKLASLPWVHKHVAVMPDVHVGKGATVGSVVAMKDAVSPSAVGVDIGCGMNAVKTNLKASDLPDSLAALRHTIERSVPVGFNDHGDKTVPGVDRLNLWSSFKDLHPRVQEREGKAMRQIGTLGGGNHFIEVCLDKGECGQCHNGYTEMADDEYSNGNGLIPCEKCNATGKDPNVWIMLHSGSRNIGKEIAETHINIAKTLTHNFNLPDPDLAAFIGNTPEMRAYRHDLMWAQNYAFENRRAMMTLVKDQFLRMFPHVTFESEISCHHNYVAEETHFGEKLLVTRKGAINAEAGRLGIIPGSMGARSFIVRGLGNPESFNSASHGAGRRYSRGAAKRAFTVADLERQTEGVECRKDQAVLDEIPSAYKDIEQVMRNQADLVEIVAELKQVLCVKG